MLTAIRRKQIREELITRSQCIYAHLSHAPFHAHMQDGHHPRTYTHAHLSRTLPTHTSYSQWSEFTFAKWELKYFLTWHPIERKFSRRRNISVYIHCSVNKKLSKRHVEAVSVPLPRHLEASLEHSRKFVLHLFKLALIEVQSKPRTTILFADSQQPSCHFWWNL